MRMTISVRDDLKNRMEAVSERVNWSAVACGAFEKRLGQIAAAKKDKTMNDVIQRLRGSKLQHASREFQGGLEDGRRWASDKAEAFALKAIAEADLKLTDESAKRSFPPAYSVAHCIYGEDTDFDIVDAFWNAAGYGFSNEHPYLGNWESRETDWVNGFVTGAVEIWNEVADKL